MGIIMRVSKEDTRSLDNGSCGWLSFRVPFCHCVCVRFVGLSEKSIEPQR